MVGGGQAHISTTSFEKLFLKRRLLAFSCILLARTYINCAITRLVSFNNGNKTKTISKTDQSRETAVCGHFHKSAFPLASIPEPKGRLLVSIYTRHPIVFASLTLNSTVFPSNSTKNDWQTETKSEIFFSLIWALAVGVREHSERPSLRRASLP